MKEERKLSESERARRAFRLAEALYSRDDEAEFARSDWHATKAWRDVGDDTKADYVAFALHLLAIALDEILDADPAQLTLDSNP